MSSIDPATALVLALDVGTSSCRARLYDAQARRAPEIGSRVRHTPSLTSDGGAELSPDQLVDEVVTTIDAVATQAGAAFSRVRAVGTSAFWHSLLGLDSAGNPLTPVYLWLDARGHDAARRLRHQLDGEAIHARTGCVLHSTYWPARLVWLHESQPGLFAAVRHWVSFGEYLTLRLFGRTAVSLSMASGTGLLDQHTRQWDAVLLQEARVEPAQLSPIAPDDQVFTGLLPAYARRWPALQDVPWLPALGDGACSNVGAGCVTPARYALTIGTSGAIRALRRTDHFMIPSDLWCYRLDHDRILLGGAFNDGGNLLGWLRRTLLLPTIEAQEDAVASVEPDAHGLTLLPLWGGERSLGWAEAATGAIVGLTLRTTPAEILRAALEAIALRFGSVAESLCAAVGGGDEVVATGGALLRSPAWLQITADVLGRPVRTLVDDESSSRGAAIMALAATGLMPAGLASVPTPLSHSYEPDQEHTVRYAVARQRQAALYAALIGGRRG